MKTITRHTRGGFRSAMAVILSETEPGPIRAMALKSAFIWGDHPLGPEFWHRNWARLLANESLAIEARNMLSAMADENPKTVFVAEARDHDRTLLRAVTHSGLNRKISKIVA